MKSPVRRQELSPGVTRDTWLTMNDQIHTASSHSSRAEECDIFSIHTICVCSRLLYSPPSMFLAYCIHTRSMFVLRRDGRYEPKIKGESWRSCDRMLLRRGQSTFFTASDSEASSGSTETRRPLTLEPFMVSMPISQGYSTSAGRVQWKPLPLC